MSVNGLDRLVFVVLVVQTVGTLPPADASSATQHRLRRSARQSI